MLRWQVLASSCFSLSVASLQGLYATLPLSGQLQLVDRDSGKTSNIGSPLASLGWLVPACTPSAIDPTNKWYFSLAHNATEAKLSNSTGPWYLVTVSLEDGSVVTATALPPCLPTQAAACDFALSPGGALDVFVATEVPDSAAPGGYRVVGGSVAPSSSFVLLLNATIPDLGIGHLLSPPAVAATSSALWLAGQRGVAGAALAAGNASFRRLMLSSGSTYTALHAAPGDVVYGVLRDSDANSSFVASFVDAGTGTPDLKHAPLALPPPFAAPPGALTAFISDAGSFAVLAGSALLSVNASSGAVLSSASLSCTTGAVMTASALGASTPAMPVELPKNTGLPPCPSSMAYEPFVF
jgi:hypothetical protein